MGLIKEPLHVDFYVDGKQITDEDQKRVSAYISQQKDKKKQNTFKMVNADFSLALAKFIR